MESTNIWHTVSAGESTPEFANCIIECPKDSKIKYELDKETGLLLMDRFLYSAVHYPGDYGMIPQTLWDDGDPLDVIVVTNRPLVPMCLAEIKVIGVLRMIDAGEKDDKIVAVYKNDPRSNKFNDISELPDHIIEELKHFFETYKNLEKKKVEVPEVLGREAALKDVERGMKMYQDKYGKKE
ncbi:MAG: inorganic pyrophosphatase [Patescibacteria group bacterium]|jgi:inorganic pyrophosphatase